MDNSTIEQILENAGVKPTAMRILVYRTLKQCNNPISLKQAEEKLVTADRSTIFRTLNLLLKKHLVHTIEDGSGSLKYELCTSHDHHSLDDQHVHFYCEQCQRTYCLHHINIPQVELPPGFQFRTANYILKGCCPNCKNTKKI